CQAAVAVDHRRRCYAVSRSIDGSITLSLRRSPGFFDRAYLITSDRQTARPQRGRTATDQKKFTALSTETASPGPRRHQEANNPKAMATEAIEKREMESFRNSVDLTRCSLDRHGMQRGVYEPLTDSYRVLRMAGRYRARPVFSIFFAPIA